MEATKRYLCLYLKESQEKFISNWKKRILVHEHDPYKNETHLLHVFTMYMREEINLQDIEDISKKIAQERMDAKVNIADFIYNTNEGKKEILNTLFLLNPTGQECKVVIEQINLFFDHLIYSTIYSYYKLKKEYIHSYYELKKKYN
ncbi:TPA: hypothetical protein QCT97_005647 [Bacillus anthracis]|uniref:histidine kinase N-terminal domain-containing protein n=2 Tax=Bacillus anthracis TaxID=1392 RepID=UPI0001B4187D|nr:histidine kinase N-terminal domain-containing protein [Bacillus anthracis]EVT89414.1 hypothetical protein U368_28695 [Bacillus anthracis 8903-G]EVT95375.1 hypothetical protein U365_28110 [Bacillus anthracis 9080-G]EVU02021.1 hypothetical protein U369_28885 [Bacillus anthracis 52-G]KFL76278.1 hypothetical protein DJ49_5665 [Bacillus anthracis]KOM64165.1 hypothetical protein AB168_00495 [Bacillus anthracis]